MGNYNFGGEHLFLFLTGDNSETKNRSYERFSGCVRLGKPDLDFQNLNLDFPIEREIRKRISPPRNPSSGWIPIKKSKFVFFGFPFLSFDWEIRKRICETVLVYSGLLFTKTVVPKDSFSNPFSDFPIER